MKELFSYAKQLERDFVNPNTIYQSKIDLALSSLVTGDYIKSKQMFDAAIEIDSLFPSAWLGKAFAEIALVEDEKFNDITIDEYIERAIRTAPEINKYRVALAGCLAYRHAVIIKKCVVAVEVAKKEKKKAEINAALGAGTAVVGSMFTGRDKSVRSNIIGGSLMVGGAVHAAQSSLKAQEMEVLGKSLFTAALSQTYLSTPIIYLCESLNNQITDNSLKNNFKVVTDSWKDSVIYLFEKQKEQLVKKLYGFGIHGAENILKVIKNPNSVQEIGELTAFLKITGLQNHKIAIILNRLFNETLKKHFSSEESIKKLKKARNRQMILLPVCAILPVVLVVSVMSLLGFFPFDTDFKLYTGWGFDSIGIIISFIIYSKTTSTEEMKKFKEEYNSAIREVNNSKISKEDFNLSLIEEQNNSNDSNLLGN